MDPAPPPPPPPFFSIPPPSFTPLPPPNPNPNPIHPPPPTDLSSAISLLGDLAALADCTLRSLSSLLPLPSPSPSFGRCPFNPHHRMPPESLFRHSLLCPSAPGGPVADLASLLGALRYPSSLESDAEFHQAHLHFQPLPNQADADLCFSLDAELGDLGCSFFYKDCPGVVTTPEPDVSSRTFSLPAILFSECANSVLDRDCDGQSSALGVRILPSEYWALRLDLEAWNDFPAWYSYTVLRVASGVDFVGNGSLTRWMIASSPRFGILIDGAMSEHLCLLLRLCLKAIGREAHSSMELFLSKDDLFDPRPLRFDCPTLIGSLAWLASQVSVLYGELNGKLFALGMVKESLLQAGSALVVGLGGSKFEEAGYDVGGACTSKQCETGEPVIHVEVASSSQDVSRRKVFVSQVAAAVAALHERSWLEDRIKAIRFSQPLPASQLMLECSYASARAYEERGKRHNYKPPLEHDGLFWHGTQNQDLGKSKTREELLAEERDYKRRRMSYRGKKIKRNTMQVLRDIIEEHMEAIKQAGGIGCNVKVSTNTTSLQVECNLQNDAARNLMDSKSSDFDLSETRRKSPAYNELLHRDFSTSDRSNMSHNLLNKHERTRDGHYRHVDDHDRVRSERRKNYGSRGSSAERTSTSFNEGTVHRREQSNREGRKYERSDYGSKSKDCSSRSTLTSKYPRKEQNYVSKYRSKDREESYESYRSESVTQDRFEDRYDPSGSYQDSEEKLCHPAHDEKKYDERRRYDHPSRRHS